MSPALCAASQLPAGEPTDVDDTPALIANDDDDVDLFSALYQLTIKGKLKNSSGDCTRRCFTT